MHKYDQKEYDLEEEEIVNLYAYKQLLWQRKLLIVTTGFTIIGIFVFVAAIFIPDWLTLDFVNTNFEHVNVRLGVWGEWRTLNTTNQPEWIPHFPEPPKNRVLRLADEDLKHYYRAQAAFCVISIAFMICNNIFAIYTFGHHRYIYKRLVGGLHVVTGMCVVVTMEALTNSVNEWNVAVASKARQHPEWHFDTVDSNGLGYYMAMAVAIIYVVAGVVFLICSHKQKGNEAATTEYEIEDRPVHIGR